MRRVCVIGAGSSGIAACQALHSRGIPFDCFEAGSSVGGNWRYDNDNGMSSAYRSLHAKSSRRGMQYAAFPMPDGYPDYLSHEMVARYLDDFVDHFGFRGRIRFRTEVTKAAPAPGGGWDVTARWRDTGAEYTGRYGAVIVANGHHWDPWYPEPAFPGAGTFAGEQIHSHHYRAPEPFTGKRVLVLGIGNSACDAAADCSRLAARTLIAMRAGTHIIPRYLAGRPADYLTFMRAGAIAPLWLRRFVVALLVRIAQGSVTKYGLPKPEHRLLCGPLAVSDSLLSGLRRGEIVIKPAIDRFVRDRVYFRDGSTEQVDVVIYCTGYKISFPFLCESLIGGPRRRDPALPSRRPACAARLVLHRAHPADRGDHAGSRDPVTVGRGSSGRPGGTATGAGDEPRDHQVPHGDRPPVCPSRQACHSRGFPAIPAGDPQGAHGRRQAQQGPPALAEGHHGGPPGMSFWQARCADWNTGELGLKPLGMRWLIPLALTTGSAMSAIPWERMHATNFSACAVTWRSCAAVIGLFFGSRCWQAFWAEFIKAPLR